MLFTYFLMKRVLVVIFTCNSMECYTAYMPLQVRPSARPSISI